MPRDKDCRICFTTFNVSSHKPKFGNTKAYHKHVSKNPDDHRGFKGGVKRLIKDVNDSQDTSLESMRKIAKKTKPVETVTEDAPPFL